MDTDAMTGATTNFSPYTISTYEDSILKSKWSFQTVPPIPGNNYQLDILINSDKIARPETVSHNVGQIDKDWEYTSNSPVGNAYHWQWKGWIADLLGATREVHARVTPSEEGTVEAKTGTYWPWQTWATGFLTIE